MAVSSVSMAQATSGMNIALLDLGYIFKNHPGFNQKMEAMKQDVQTFEQQLKQRQQQIEATGRTITQFKPGTPDYKRIEETATKDLAELKVQMQLKRKEIMEQEAAIYMATYKEVAGVVAAFANRKNIDLVLRYDRDDASSEVADPRETLKIINRPVIFEKQLDISQLVLQQIGGRAAPTSSPATAQRPTRNR
jgi:Skp family chaperone for outer membrane proteins